MIITFTLVFLKSIILCFYYHNLLIYKILTYDSSLQSLVGSLIPIL